MIYNEICDWVEKLPYWQQYIADIIFKYGIITDIQIKYAYDLFKEECALEESKSSHPNIEFQRRVEKEKEFNSIKWISTKEIQGVNALKENEVFEVGEQVTLVYGENGTGKTGYTRLFNNAFISKGDKSLIPNIYENRPNEMSAVFCFSVNGECINVQYPKDASNQLLKYVTVFDTKSATTDMEKESEINYVPEELRFFDLFIHACVEVNLMLENEISLNKKDNPFTIFFKDDTEISRKIKEISAETNLADLKDVIEISSSEEDNYKSEIKEKATLISLNIGNQSKKLHSIHQILQEKINMIREYNELFSNEVMGELKKKINIYNEFKDIANKEGLSQFQDKSIYNLGSKQWKEFIVAAKNYYTSINENVTKCIFCGQSIVDVDVIDKYWKYIESVAEKNFIAIKTALAEKEKKYTDITTNFMSQDSILYSFIEENCKNYIQIIENEYSKIKANREKVIKQLQDKKWTDDIKDIQFDINCLLNLSKVIADKIESLDEKKISDRIKVLEEKDKIYVDKMKALQLIDKIEEYVSICKWVKKAEKNKISTRSITKKQNEMFNKYITSEYIALFKDECDRLNANFNVEITQRGSKGITLKKLSLNGNLPGNILSEGEQRAIAIADFMAETNIVDSNCAVIFDDPVTSLDHKRRDAIVKRLVDESKKRQVIIFTHDISFFMQLQSTCEKESIQCQIETIRKVGTTPGNISKVIPWVAMKVSERIKKLSNDLIFIKKIEDSGDVDEYSYKVKAWCELLRESWERSVEEILLNSAIQRFNPSVQTQRLKKAPFTRELYQDVEKGMGECSAWCHDRPSELNENVPTFEQLSEYLTSFKEFVKENNPEKIK